MNPSPELRSHATPSEFDLVFRLVGRMVCDLLGAMRRIRCVPMPFLLTRAARLNLPERLRQWIHGHQDITAASLSESHSVAKLMSLGFDVQPRLLHRPKREIVLCFDIDMTVVREQSLGRHTN